MVDNKKIFLEFERELAFTYGQFCIWNEFNDRNIFPYSFWETSFSRVIYFSVINNCLSNLAKLTEKQNSKKDNEVLSVFYLIEFGQLSDCSKTIEKISKIRNKTLAHKDLKKSLDYIKFLDEVNLTISELEILFSKLITVLDHEKINYKTSVDYKKYFNELKTDYKKEIWDINRELKSKENRINMHTALEKRLKN